MKVVSGEIKARSFSGDGLAALGDGFGQVAEGLDGLSRTLAPTGVAEVGKGLGGTADYLEGTLLPAAERAAASLDKAGVGLKSDASKLTTALKEAPLEWKVAREAVDGLAKFEEGLEQLAKLSKLESFERMREGFKGLESSLDTGAVQVERLAKYSYPKVTVKGLRVEVEEIDFWPDGKEIATGMRKGAKGCRAAGQEMDAIAKELPKLGRSLEQGQAVVKATRVALTAALIQQEKIEPILKRLPRNLALLAEELPRLTSELARVLRETSRLKEVARALRQAEKSMALASENWPALRNGLEKSAHLLRTARKQTQRTLAHREEYEETLRQTVELTEHFSEALPAMLEEVGMGMEQQQASLEELSGSIDAVSEAVPQAAATTSRALTTMKTLLGLFALALGLHATILWRAVGKKEN